VRLSQPGTDGVDLLGVPVKLSRTPGAPAGPGPALGEHTRSVLESVGYSPEEVDALLESGAAAEAAGEARGSFLS
jgi:alpha-methylacyl-CoA racemase